MIKTGIISNEARFVNDIRKDFTPYFHPFIRWVNKLRKRVFPFDKALEREDKTLYSQMREILCNAMKDPDVLADWTE